MSDRFVTDKISGDITWNVFWTEVLVLLWTTTKNVTALNTAGMSHLKIINTSEGYIRKYENLKKETIQLQSQNLL